MPDQETPKTPEQINFEAFKQKYLEVLKDPEIPDIFKVFLRQTDVLLIFSKLKPMTEFYVQTENFEEFEKRGYWDSSSEEDFLKLLKDQFGVESFEDFREGKDALYRIYDPEQIKTKTKEFPRLLKWDESKNLRDWINANLDAGVPMDYVKGALYGFPKSSIDFYLAKGGFMDVDIQGISTYGEDYGVPPGELAPDVLAREQAKTRFFEQFEKDQEIQAELAKTEDLKNELLEIKKEIIKQKDAQDERLKK